MNLRLIEKLEPVTCARESEITMDEPQELSASIAMLISEYPEGHPLHEIGKTLAKSARICARRRAAVLKHDDLAKQLTRSPIGYRLARQWNGWIPPAMVNLGESEMLHSLGASGVVRWNQRGMRTQGEIPNDSPRRAALVALSQEAWQREQEAVTTT